MEACVLNNLYVIIQKTMSSQKLEEDVMISFVNPRKGRSSRSQIFTEREWGGGDV